MNPFGKYVDYQALAKLEYGRMLWKSQRGRNLLLANWTHPKHPHRDLFFKMQSQIERILEAPLDYHAMDEELRQNHSSLRAAMREVPTYFPSLLKKVD